MTTDVRTADYIQRARDLAPITEQYRDQGEAERRLPAPLAAAMREKGLFSLWLPKALGGPQVDLETSVQVTEELSRQDADSLQAWLHGVPPSAEQPALLLVHLGAVAPRELVDLVGQDEHEEGDQQHGARAEEVVEAPADEGEQHRGEDELERSGEAVA